MANVPNPHQYERDINKRIDERLREIIEDEEDLAQERYLGKAIRFTHRWHSIDPAPLTIEAPITRVYLDQDDDGGKYHLLFEVVALNPHTGKDETLTRWPGVEFV